MRYEISFNESFFTICTSGELSVEGHQLFLRELVTHPKWKAGTNVLVDHRAASMTNITLNDMRMVSLIIKQLKGHLGSGGRWAIVLADSAEFTKVAIWKVMTAPEVSFEIEYFNSMETAGKWLCERKRTLLAADSRQTPYAKRLAK